MAGPRLYPSGSGPHRDESSNANTTTDGSGRRFYDPYQDLNIPTAYKNHLPLVQRRSWGENLPYYTGVGYLSSAIAGAAVGLRKAAHAAERGDIAKIRANRVLNSWGSAGRRISNHDSRRPLASRVAAPSPAGHGTTAEAWAIFFSFGLTLIWTAG